MTGIKFCGLRRKEDVYYVNEIGADYAGFIVTRGFSRSVGVDGIRILTKLLRKDIRPVGVFVDESIDIIAQLANEGTISMIQLHGSESEGYIRELRSMTPVPIIRSFTISSEEDVRAANASSADYVLLDSGKGTGKTFDWTLLSEIKREYFLAGGLDAGNVEEAIRKLHPKAVDTSSRMETDGCKDYNKMSAFARSVRTADAVREDEQ